MTVRLADLSRYRDFTDGLIKDTLREYREPGEDEASQARRMAKEIKFAVRLLNRLNLDECVMGLDEANLYVEVHGAYCLQRLGENERAIINEAVQQA